MKIVAFTNQKGGVGKTNTTVNLAVGLARMGKKVLIVDTDPQGDATKSLGFDTPDAIPHTLATLMEKSIRDEPISPEDYAETIVHNAEGVDLIPSNIDLSAIEVSLVNAMNREQTLAPILHDQRSYDYVLLDCMPSLGMIPLNCLAAADRVIIPVQAQYLPAKGLEQLLKTVVRVRRKINPRLEIGGILLTMTDQLRIFLTEIPRAVRAAEASIEGKSIFAHDPRGKVTAAYAELAKEVLSLERTHKKADLAR